MTMQIQSHTSTSLVSPRGPCSSSAHRYPHWALCSGCSSAKSPRTQATAACRASLAIAARTSLGRSPAATGEASGATSSTTRRLPRRQGCTRASMTSRSLPRRSPSRDIMKIPSRINDSRSISRRGMPTKQHLNFMALVVCGPEKLVRSGK